jgi:ribonuclease HI
MNNGNFIEAYFDGACMPFNPSGYMGAGIYIKEGGNAIEIAEGWDKNFRNSNNVAEYKAIILLLQELKYKKKMVIRIYGDSQLVINQLNSTWKIKHGRYVDEANLAMQLLRELRKNNIVTLKWIPREQNAIADKLSKEGVSKVYNLI